VIINKGFGGLRNDNSLSPPDKTANLCFFCYTRPGQSPAARSFGGKNRHESCSLKIEIVIHFSNSRMTSRLQPSPARSAMLNAAAKESAAQFPYISSLSTYAH